MASPYRIFGMENSPYSVKVRSYCRYKAIPHEWIPRDASVMAEYQKYARLPIVPLLVTPDDQGVQDSTPIIEMLEGQVPEPSIHPSDPLSAFVSALIEEFGDEWGNKWMFHYRWAREADQQACSRRLVAEMMPQLDAEQAAGMAKGIVDRMIGRVWFVGSNEQTAPQIEASFVDGIALLERHLEGRRYLFGGRPSFGDFGLWGQVYNAHFDPTPRAILDETAPNVVAWTERMLEPKAEADFELWSSLDATLTPFIEKQIGGLFLPWSVANAVALASGEEEFTVEIASGAWTQKPQKYHAKSLKAIRAKYAEAAGNGDLDELLRRTHCLSHLREEN